MLSILLTLIAIVVFIRQKRIIQFYVVILAALFPITLGNFRNIPNLLIIEWASPIFFVIMLNELINLNPILREKKIVDFNGAKIFTLAFFILLSWAAISFVNNQILEPSISQTKYTGVTRLYFSMVNGFLFFLSIIFFFNRHYNEINIVRWLKIIIYFSMVSGGLGLVSYLMRLDIPFLAGSFDYQPESTTRFGGITYRMSGLEMPGVVGLSSTLALFSIKRKFNYYYLIIFALLLFFSGGRTIWAATFLALGVFFVVLFPNKLGYVISIGIISIIVALIILPQNIIEGQLGRITAIDTSADKNWSRAAAYKLYVNNFMKHPVLGKGITPYEGYVDYSSIEGTREFARLSAGAGGHGSYISILSTFGIGGLSYLLLMLFGSIIYSFKLFAKNRSINLSFTAVSVFTLLLILVKMIYYISSHSGLDDFALYGIVSIVASFMVLENKKNLTPVTV